MNDLELINNINKHLLEDEKPSVYLNKLKDQGEFKDSVLGDLALLEDIQQEKEHHPEGNVWIHTMQVVDEAAKRKNESSDKKIFMWAALLHDLGKLVATKKIRGKWRAYNHDIEGEKIAKKILNNFDFDDEFKMKVTALVRWHMQPLFVLKSLPYARVDDMKREISINEVALLEICDRLGRGEYTKKDEEKVSKEMNEFIKKCEGKKSK